MLICLLLLPKCFWKTAGYKDWMDYFTKKLQLIFIFLHLERNSFKLDLCFSPQECHTEVKLLEPNLYLVTVSAGWPYFPVLNECVTGTRCLNQRVKVRGKDIPKHPLRYYWSGSSLVSHAWSKPWKTDQLVSVWRTLYLRCGTAAWAAVDWATKWGPSN